jgi:hypothetical protein
MSKVKAKIDGFMTVDGTPVLLAAGDEFDSDHPLVRARPELFTEPVEEPKRPVLSRVKGKGADD